MATATGAKWPPTLKRNLGISDPYSDDKKKPTFHHRFMFSIYPDEENNCGLADVIKASHGELVPFDANRERFPNEIVLLNNYGIVISGAFENPEFELPCDLFDPTFLKDFSEMGMQNTDLNKYRMTRSWYKDYDANDILCGFTKWTDLEAKSRRPPPVKIKELDDTIVEEEEYLYEVEADNEEVTDDEEAEEMEQREEIEIEGGGFIRSDENGDDELPVEVPVEVPVPSIPPTPKSTKKPDVIFINDRAPAAVVVKKFRVVEHQPVVPKRLRAVQPRVATPGADGWIGGDDEAENDVALNQGQRVRQKSPVQKSSSVATRTERPGPSTSSSTAASTAATPRARPARVSESSSIRLSSSSSDNESLAESLNEEDFEDNASAAGQQNVQVQRRDYQPYESQAILDYVVRKGYGGKTGGNEMWKQLCRSGKLVDKIGVRTFQSLNNHFRRVIWPQLQKPNQRRYRITDEQLKQLKKDIMRAKRTPHTRH